MADRENGSPKPPPRWGRITRTASFWALIIIVSVALVKLTSVRAKPTTELAYSQYRRELAAGNITKVEFVGLQMRGETRNALTVPNPRPGVQVRNFTTRLPTEFAIPEEMQELRAAGVTDIAYVLNPTQEASR